MGMIKESFILTATDADILAAPSRLAAIPRDGILTIEASSTDCTTVNNGQLTLQLPDGIIPFEDLIIPAAGVEPTDSVLDIDTKFIITVPVVQGGHVGLGYLETGTVVSFFLHVTLTF